jgi:hypothetical protein
MIGVVLSGSLDDWISRNSKAGGLSMVLTPAVPPERGMPENAIKFDGPISLIGSSKEIAEAIARLVGPSLEHRFAPRIDPC